MPGFLLEEDAVQARLSEYDSWIEERKRQAEEAKKAAQAAAQPAVQAVQQAVQPVVQGVSNALSEYDSWLQQRQAAQPAPPTAPLAEQPTAASAPSLSHAEEPATRTDTIAAPDLGGKWKTNFDFGATYTGSYRTGTPHRGIDMVPVQGGIGTEVSAFHPGTVTAIQRDLGAGGLMVYVRDDQGLTHAYMHLAGTAPGLAVGQQVARGQPLAQMGESGTEGSPHLHYEVRKNAATGDPLDQLIDPRPYVAGAPARVGAASQTTATATPTAQTTAGLSGGGELAGRIGEQGQQILSGAATVASWLGEQGQKALQAVLVTEGGLSGARGDNQASAGPLQFFGEEGGRAGQLNNFAKAAGMGLEQARQYVIANPLEAIRWAIGVPSNPGYLGLAIMDGISKGLTGADLATHIQRIGQVSVTPERAGAVWNSLFGQGQPVQQAVSTARTGAEAALGGAVEQSGAARRTAEDLAASTGRTLSDLQRQGAESTAQFDQFRADAARRAGEFTAGTQRMAEGARAGLDQFDPNRGLAQVDQAATEFLRQGGTAGSYFDRLGRTGQQLGQHAVANPLTPLITPQEFGQGLQQQFTTGVPAKIMQADRETTDAAANAVLAKSREMGATPTPEQERALRTALSAFGPSMLPLMFVGGGATGVIPRIAEGLGYTALSGAGMAAGEALEPELPEWLRPFAPFIGGMAAPMAGGMAAAGIRGAARSPTGVGRFLREESGELRIPGGEPGPEPMAPSMGGGTVGVSQSPTFLRESLRRMYPGAINKAAVKEGVQNFVDASREISGASATVSVDNTNRTISMLDQGKGMTPQVMEDVFVKLGGSSKPVGASGGMGTAIKAIMANAEETWVRSIGRDPLTGAMTDSVMHGSGDDFLGGSMHRYYAPLGELPESELAGAPSEIRNVGGGPNGTGTLVWTKPMADVNWDPHTLNNWIGQFNKTNRIAGQSVDFVVDGKPIDPGTRIGWDGNPRAIPDAEKPTQFLKTIKVPGAEIDFYGSSGTAETGYADIMLLNNGQYQADMSMQLPGNAKMPQALVADVRATIGPKEVGYPWTADRNSLIDTAQQAIKGYVRDELAADLIGQENARVRESITRAPNIGPVKLVDDAQIGESFAADRLAEIPKHPAYRRLASIINDLHENLIAELEGRTIPTPRGEGDIGPSHLIGLGVSNKWLGLNVPPSYAPWADSGDTAKGILIEPWQIWREVERAWPNAGRVEQINRYVDGLVATMLHEIAHNTQIGGHEEGFAGLLTRIPQFLGSRMHQAITNELRKRVTTIWDTLADDLASDATHFGNAARESGIERYGIESGVTGPGAARAGRPGVTEGAVPLPDQGGPGAGRPPGSADVPPGGAPEGPQPQPGLAQAGKAASTGQAPYSAQSLMDAYEAVTPQRVASIQQRVMGLLAPRLAGRGADQAAVRALIQQVWETGKSMLAESRVTATGISEKAARALAEGGQFTNKLNMAGTAADSASVTRQQLGPKKGSKVTLAEAEEFVRREGHADVMALGSTQAPSVTGNRDPFAMNRVYAYTSAGPPLIGPNKPAMWLTWEDEAPRVVSAHHHYGLGSPNAAIHQAGTPPGLKKLMWDKTAVQGDLARTPAGDIIQNWRNRGMDVGGGRRAANTDALVGPSGEADMRMATVLAGMPQDVVDQIRSGKLTDPEQIAAVLLREAVPQSSPGQVAARQVMGLPLNPKQGKQMGVPFETFSDEAKDALSLGAVDNGLRTESLMVDPKMEHVKAIYIAGTQEDLAKVLPNTGGKTRLEMAQAIRQRIMTETGKDVPIIFKDITPEVSGGQPSLPSKMISDARVLEGPQDVTLAPGRERIVQGYTDAGYRNIGSFALGGTAGAASDEDLTPEERLKRGLGGALIAGATRSPGAAGRAGRLLGDVRGVLRGVTPAQTSAQAVAAAQGAKTGGQHVAEFISSNLLSGPGLIWNVLNQTGHLGWQPLQRAVEGHPIEALTALHSLVGSGEALSRAGAVLGRGTPYAGVGGVQSRPLDKVSVGLRANLAGDAVLRTLNENMAGMLEAQRLIREAGATTPQQAQAVINKNAAQIQAYAEKHGNISALTGGTARSPWIQSLSQTKTRLLESPEVSKQLSGVAMHILMPFARVPEEVMYQTVRNAPLLGQVLDAFDVVKAAPGERGQATSKMALNAAIAGGVLTAALANEIRSADDPEHPNQAHIGNSWVPLTSLGTLGGRMALAAAVADGIRYPKKPGVEQQIATAVNNLGKVGVQEYPLFDTIRTLGRIGQGGLTSVASGLGSQVLSGLTPVSGALGAVGNITDPLQRDPATSGWGDVYEPNMARIPGLAAQLPTRVNQATGEPLRKQSSGLGSLLRIQNEPKTQGAVAQEVARLEKLGYQIPNPQDNPETISYAGSSIPLSREEAQRVAQARGQLIAQQLDQYVNSPYWAQLTDDQKAQIIARVMGSANERNATTLAGMVSPSDLQGRVLAGRKVVGRPQPAGVGR